MQIKLRVFPLFPKIINQLPFTWGRFSVSDIKIPEIFPNIERKMQVGKKRTEINGGAPSQGTPAITYLKD
jgi:hypothetical protein